MPVNNTVSVPNQSKLLETTQHTVASQTVQRQVIVIADDDTNTYLTIGANGAQVDVRNVVALPLPNGAATEASLGTDGATPPVITGTGIRGWLRAIYEKLSASLAVTVAALPLPTGAATETTLAALNAKNPTLVGGRVPVDGSAVTQPVSLTAIPLATNAATSTIQTDGTQKAIMRGGAKGATTAADTTTTAQGADHQAHDVQVYHGGVAVNPAAIRALTSADIVGDFYFALSRGLISGQMPVFSTGTNSDVDVGVEDVISQGGIYTQPTAARVHNIASSSANDTSAGTGARTVSVTGLNASYAEVTEIVNMNGTSNVATVNSYIFISRLRTETAGSNSTNAGTITATAQTDGTISAQVDIGFGQAGLAVYQVPAGKTAYLFQAHGSVIVPTAGATSSIRLMAKAFGGAWVRLDGVGLCITGSSFASRALKFPYPFPEKSLIKLQTEVDTNNCAVFGGFDFVLVDN